jgi:hypothetical protein
MGRALLEAEKQRVLDFAAARVSSLRGLAIAELLNHTSNKLTASPPSHENAPTVDVTAGRFFALSP